MDTKDASAPAEDAAFMLPEGTLVEVTMTVRLPTAATEDDVQAWLRVWTHNQ